VLSREGIRKQRSACKKRHPEITGLVTLSHPFIDLAQSVGSLFWTPGEQTGKIRWVQYRVQQDDSLSISPAATPFLLRSGSGKEKILEGPCYIDDIMEGKAATAAKLGTQHLWPL